MNRFDYQFPVRIHFGQGCFEDSLKNELQKYGKNVVLAYGGGSLKRTGLYDRIVAMLNEAGKTVTDFGGIMPNPTLKKVQEGQHLARETKADLILAVGGGSVSDCCKIVAMGDTPIPLGVVVTASGTGSEQNNGAVITDEEKKVKGAMWGVFADFAILDPDLTKTVPMKQVISGAFDTLSHCMETYLGHPHTCNLSDRINEAVQRSVIKNLKAIIANPDDDFARSELMWASAMGENGILKLGKVTDFQCHMIEHQLGAYTDCNHGQGLAVIHPAVYRHLLDAGKEKLARMAEEVWSVKGITQAETAALGIDALEAFIKEIGLPTHWSEMGITDERMLRAAADTCFITPGCCRQMSRDEIFEILKEVM